MEPNEAESTVCVCRTCVAEVVAEAVGDEEDEDEDEDDDEAE
jgi:hypothetical protein